MQDKAAPIVLLRAAGEPLAAGVAPGDDKLGFMLPYTPLHTLLMTELDNPIVLTSGNVSDEPQCTDNDEALQNCLASPIIFCCTSATSSTGWTIRWRG